MHRRSQLSLEILIILGVILALAAIAVTSLTNVGDTASTKVENKTNEILNKL